MTVPSRCGNGKECVTVFILSFLLAMLLISTAQASYLRGVIDRLDDYTAGANTTHRINFTLTTALSACNNIYVEFPPEFELSLPPLSLGATSHNITLAALVGNTVRLHVEEQINESEHCYVELNNIKNPLIPAGTYNIIMHTTTDADDTYSAPFEIVSPAPCDGWLGLNVTPADNLAGALTIYRINFTTFKPVKKGGHINITFPAGFSLTNVSVGPCSPCEVSLDSVIGQTVVLDILADMPSKTRYKITLNNIKNTLMPDEYTLTLNTTYANGTLAESITSAYFSITVPSEVTLRMRSIAYRLVELLDAMLRAIPTDTAGALGDILQVFIELLDSFIDALRTI
ncbi:hypothetical protein [Candidatus Alkanophaga liquidiphilum]|nr:hypothetical protein [Candidatus Alkanophaga liquidiphilum]